MAKLIYQNEELSGVVDSYLDPSSEHAVQNKVITAELGNKQSSYLGREYAGKVLSVNSAGYIITSEPGSSVIDTEMSDSSVHPVQNKVIKEYVDNHAGGETPIASYTDLPEPTKALFDANAAYFAPDGHYREAYFGNAYHWCKTIPILHEDGLGETPDVVLIVREIPVTPVKGILYIKI